MKLRKLLAKCASGLLVTTMVFSLVACGEKESNDDNEKKETKDTVTKTVDELVDEMSAKASTLSTDMIDKALEDDCFTYDEFEEIIKSTSAFKAEGKMNFDFSFEGEADGEKENGDAAANASYLMEYDNKNMGFYFCVDMDVKALDESNAMKMEYWIVNEDGTFYAYQKTSLDEVAIRTELGNLKEAFADGITKDDLDSLSEALEMPAEYTEMMDAMKDFNDSKMMKELSKHMSLAKKYAEYAGKKYYDLSLNFDAAKILDIFKDTEEVKSMLEDAGLEDIDALLDFKVSDGLTVKKILDVVKFDINYYIDPTDLFMAHMECNFKDFLNNSFDLLETYLVDTAKENGSELTIDFNCKNASISYDFDKDADVTVKFDGEYEDAPSYDDYDDLDYDDEY